MSVYVVMLNGAEDRYLVGVFSSEEKARLAVVDDIEENSGGGLQQDDYDIMEVEVDEPVTPG